MNKSKPTLDLAPMNFFQVLEHIRTITTDMAEDMTSKWSKGEMAPMTADQLHSVIQGTTCAAAEGELVLWVKARGNGYALNNSGGRLPF